MIHRRIVSLPSTRLLWLSLVVSGSLGCAAEGADADCPEMPVTDDPFDPELVEWREEAEARGCVAPRGKPIE
jgi:hypothetical protein